MTGPERIIPPHDNTRYPSAMSPLDIGVAVSMFQPHTVACSVAKVMPMRLKILTLLGGLLTTCRARDCDIAGDSFAGFNPSLLDDFVYPLPCDTVPQSQVNHRYKLILVLVHYVNFLLICQSQAFLHAFTSILRYGSLHYGKDSCQGIYQHKYSYLTLRLISPCWHDSRGGGGGLSGFAVCIIDPLIG